MDHPRQHLLVVVVQDHLDRPHLEVAVVVVA
jgi:hypothetical protein